MEPGNRFDAYTPKEMARKAVAVGIAKSGNDCSRTLMLAVLAGVYIALAGCFYTTAATGIPSTLFGSREADWWAFV